METEIEATSPREFEKDIKVHAIEQTLPSAANDYAKGTISLGPGQLFEAYLLNESIVERLKLLDYESEFLPKSDSYKLIPRLVTR